MLVSIIDSISAAFRDLNVIRFILFPPVLKRSLEGFGRFKIDEFNLIKIHENAQRVSVLRQFFKKYFVLLWSKIGFFLDSNDFVPVEKVRKFYSLKC